MQRLSVMRMEQVLGLFPTGVYLIVLNQIHFRHFEILGFSASCIWNWINNWWHISPRVNIQLPHLMIRPLRFFNEWWFNFLSTIMYIWIGAYGNINLCIYWFFKLLVNWCMIQTVRYFHLWSRAWWRVFSTISHHRHVCQKMIGKRIWMFPFQLITRTGILQIRIYHWLNHWFRRRLTKAGYSHMTVHWTMHRLDGLRVSR